MFQYYGKKFELIFVGILPEVAFLPYFIHFFMVFEDFKHLPELVIEDYGAHLVASEGVPMENVGELVEGKVDIVLLVVMCVEEIFPGEYYGPEWPVVLAFMVGFGVGRIIGLGMDDDFFERIDQILAHSEGEHDIIAGEEGFHLGLDVDLGSYELVFVEKVVDTMVELGFLVAWEPFIEIEVVDKELTVGLGKLFHPERVPMDEHGFLEDEEIERIEDFVEEEAGKADETY